jgi:hypothetical protein
MLLVPLLLIAFAGLAFAVDGLYVVKTDWTIPTTRDWNAIAPAPLPAKQPLNGQNNGVFTSLMSPGTSFGHQQPPLFRNIFVEDTPNVLFSLKIVPPICAPNGLVCRQVTLTKESSMSLNIENLFTPVSTSPNSIGFQILPTGFVQDGQSFGTDYTLKGVMNVGLINVFVKWGFIWLPLTSGDALSVGKVGTNGNVDIKCSFGFP